MKNSLRQFETRTRAAFTLVEMLVAVGILVVLTTLTVTAFTVNDADRVGNSVATFKNALEGARSRAINSGEVRGLRLITDPNDGRIVKSMVYIGSAGINEGNGIIVYEPRFRRWTLANNDRNEWENLFNRNLIPLGSRVEVPVGSGHWYTVTGGDENYADTDMIFSGGDREVLFLAEHFYPNRPATINLSGVPTATFIAEPNSQTTFRLELASTVLDGAEPILLDPQTCIDMDGSFVPNNWRPGDVDDPYGIDSSGMSPVRTNMDILFAPDGTITGNIKTFGVLRFRFAYVSDVVLAENLGGRPLIQAATPPAAVVPANPEKDHKAVSIFSQTGGIVITEIDPTTSGTAGGFNSNIASQPFSYALRGQESN